MAENSHFLRWYELDYRELERYHPDGAKDLLVGKKDGFLVRDVLSQQEAEALASCTESLSVNLQFPMPFGFICGEPLMVSQADRKPYFENARRYRHELIENCGFDFDARLVEVFSKLSGQQKVAIPQSAAGDIYGASVIRVIEPNTYGLHAHSGNEFINEYESMSELADKANLYNQLSYFVVLRAPELGGELCLYDLEWEQTPAEVHSNRYPHFSLARDDYFERFEKHYIRPQVGDLIYFAGGRIWHQVCPVIGLDERITIGGFTSFSNDDKDLYIWS